MQLEFPKKKLLKDSMKKQNTFGRLIATVILFLIIIGGISFLFDNNNKKVNDLTYTELLTEITNSNVKTMLMSPEGQVVKISGTLASYEEGVTFSSTIVNSDAQLAQIDEAANNANITVTSPSNFGNILSSLMPIILMAVFIGFFIFMMRKAGGANDKAMAFGKNKSLVNVKPNTKFTDVAGYEEEKEEVSEVVDFLKNPTMFRDMGARIPKGILLVGPPGTGKTLLARSVAGEADVPFFAISGSDFVEMFVGVGAGRVRDMFKTAKKNAPCIIFIDEIDAVGRRRGSSQGNSNDEREQTLNQLLVELDGFDSNTGVIIIAATNRSDILDPALTRPGRFDREVMIDLPDLRSRKLILQLHASRKKLTKDVDLEIVARNSPGLSGADLENILNEAAIIAVRENKKEIDMQDISEGMDRAMAGPARKNKKVSDKERKLVAYHESGHAIIGLELDNASVVEKVTIIPRGRIGGFALSVPKEDKSFHTKEDLLDRVTGLLGGRAAEEIFLKEVSTGASNDFEQATNIARAMVTQFGMSSLGMRQFEKQNSFDMVDRSFSDDIALQIDQEINKILNDSYKRAKRIINKRKADLELMAATLLDVETLDGEEIRYLIKNRKKLKRSTAKKYTAIEIKKIEEHGKLIKNVEENIFKKNLE